MLSQIEADFYPHRVGFDEQVGQEKASSLHRIFRLWQRQADTGEATLENQRQADSP